LNVQHRISQLHKHRYSSIEDNYLFMVHVRLRHPLLCIHTVHVRICNIKSFNHTHISITVDCSRGVVVELTGALALQTSKSIFINQYIIISWREVLYKRLTEVSDSSCLLLLVRGHHLFDLSYRLSWVQALGTSLGAVHDSVASVEGERILQLGQTFLCEFVS